MRGKRIAKIVIALAVVGIAYVAFKDDIAKLWQDLHVKIVEHPTAEENRLARPGHQQGKAELVLSRRSGNADLRLPL